MALQIVALEHAGLSAIQRLLLRFSLLLIQAFIPLGRVPGDLNRYIAKIAVELHGH